MHSISVSYTKQNAGADLNWRPTREWNLGAAYGYERYDWTRADVDVTNENSGKVFADWKPWILAHGARKLAQFRSGDIKTTTILAYVGNFQWIELRSTQYALLDRDAPILSYQSYQG